MAYHTVFTTTVIPSPLRPEGKLLSSQARQCQALKAGGLESAIWGQHVLRWLPPPQVPLLYPSITPAVEQPLQMSPHSVYENPEDGTVCEVKEINIEEDEGKTLIFIQLSL